MGALMISIDCTHPDLEDFITIKSDLGKVTAANISVRVSDDFMQAVIDDNDWELYFERPETGEKITKTVKAKEIYHLLCKNNWDYAEPGILFWDRIENYNLLSNNPDFSYAGTNPCAEEPLPAGGSCLLGALNLAEFVHHGKFDFFDFRNAVNIATIALNDVLDEGMGKHPLQEQRESVRDWRQIGLGIMGLADMLIKCGIKYGSQYSITLCDEIGQAMAEQAIQTSAMLADKFGSYPKFDDRVWGTEFFKNHNNVRAASLRNSQLLTIAPTGSISTMIGVSGGIEPIFANYYTRITKSLHGHDEEYKVYTPIVKNYMDEHDLTDDTQLPEYFVTSSTISIDERIAMQSIWQSHIDASISSTVNLPEHTSIEDVEKLYMHAWQAGLKGITVYRAGCKRSAILSTGTTNNTTEESNVAESNTLKRGMIINCSNDLVGKKRKLTTGCGSLHVLAYFDQETGEMQEVFLSKGSTGGCANFMTGLSRMISLLCRAGVDIYAIKDQLDSTGVCPSYATRRATKHDTSSGSCCPMAIGNALVDMYEEMRNEVCCDDYDECSSDVNDVEAYVAKCPECGNSITFEGGCNICKNCGWTKCD